MIIVIINMLWPNSTYFNIHQPATSNVNISTTFTARTTNRCYRLSVIPEPQLGAKRPQRSRWFQGIPVIFHKNQTRDTAFFECYLFYSYIINNMFPCQQYLLCYIPICSHVNKFCWKLNSLSMHLTQPLMPPPSRTASAANTPPAAHPPKVPAAANQKSGICF